MPSPAGMLNTAQNHAPFSPGRRAAAKNPPQSRPVPHSAAQRGPFFILQKTTDDASHPERCDQDAERIASAVLGQAELVHHRLLEHAPRRRQARQDLNGRPRRQDRPGVARCKLLFHLPFITNGFPLSVCPFSLTKRHDSL